MPHWMRGFLLLAGIYNLAWGIFIYSYSEAFYVWLAEADTKENQWVEYQGIGVIVFGLVYLLACLYPIRFWFLILLGLLSKLCGGLIVYHLIVDKSLTDHFIFHLLVNDLAWVVPLAIITFRAFRLRKKLPYEKPA